LLIYHSSLEVAKGNPTSRGGENVIGFVGPFWYNINTLEEERSPFVKQSLTQSRLFERSVYPRSEATRGGKSRQQKTWDGVQAPTGNSWWFNPERDQTLVLN